jgi:flavin reductase (DIM6/NTAB) family NADH-FMN oxidoreductase RutF
MEARQLRNALGRFTTGVTIITCVDQSVDGPGGWVGLTANSFSSLSLSPPLVLWSLRNESPMLAAFKAASHFAVNVLAEAQVELSRRFAARAGDPRFAEGPWALGGQGAPVLAGCAAVFECRSVSHQLAGDHHLFIGEVLACEEAALPPLVFQAGHYRLLGEVL